MPDGQTTLSQVQPAAIGLAEVLRGPGSAVWGNASGGVIRLEGRAPPAAGRTESIEVSGGGHGGLRLASTTAGRASSVGWRVDATRRDVDGYRDHAGSETWRLAARVERPLAGGSLDVALHGVASEADNPGSLTAEQRARDPAMASPASLSQDTREEARHLEVGATWEKPWGRGRLVVSGWGLGRSVDNPIPPAVVRVDRVAGGARALYRGGSEADGNAVRWSAGLEVDVQRDERTNFENDGGEAGALTLLQDEDVRSVAPFARIAWPVGGRVSILTALRYDRIRFRADDRLVGAGDPDESGARTLDAWSPSIGATFALGRRATVFANVATGFETPTTSELANRPDGSGGFDPDLEPQRTRSAELGLRARPAAWARLDVALYTARVEDLILLFEVPAQPGRQFFDNRGEALHRGVEAAIDLAGGRARAQLAWSWTDARFAGGALDDRRVPGVAPHRLEAVGAIERAGWTAEVVARWVDAIPVDDENTGAAPSYGLVDLAASGPRLGIGAADVRLSGGVSNVFDTSYVASVVVNAFGGRYFEPGAGRSAWAGASIEWRR